MTVARSSAPGLFPAHPRPEKPDHATPPRERRHRWQPSERGVRCAYCGRLSDEMVRGGGACPGR